MVALVIAYLIFNIYACISGFKDSVIYSLKGAEAFPWDEHKVYMSERIAVVSLMVCATFIDVHSLWVLIVCIALSFSFWHNGFYYEGRDWMGKEDYHFYSNSTTSTAKLEFKWWTRVVMKVASIIILTLYIIFYEN